MIDFDFKVLNNISDIVLRDLAEPMKPSSALISNTPHNNQEKNLANHRHENFTMQSNFHDFFHHLPLNIQDGLSQSHYFWQHFQGKHSTTALFKNDQFKIEVLNPESDLNLYFDNHAALEKNLEKTWRRQTLIYINNILFMYAYAQTEYPSYCATYFDLVPIQKSLGAHIHKPYIQRGDFSFIMPSFVLDATLIQPHKQAIILGRHSPFIWQAPQKNDELNDVPPLNLFEYFIISDELLDLLEKRCIDV